MKSEKRTLLIVEDDEDHRLFIETAFCSLDTGYRIFALEGGNEAVAYLKGQGKFSDRAAVPFPSCIITDLKMPDGDGFTILDFLKSNPALSVIPVVMLSTSDDSDDVRHAFLLGVSSFFVKPVAQEQLRSLLRKIHEYWLEGQVPEIDADGYAVETSSKGKAGERFSKPVRPAHRK
jgi:CheY-like chemotaxis protein